MDETPTGTPVGVDDPYEHAGVCDHLTDDGRCRFSLAYGDADPEFAAERRAHDYRCLAADEDSEWRDCPHYRSTTSGEFCVRCGLEEVRLAHDRARPLVEEHHLSYGSGSTLSHEITVSLCRWCHAKVHDAWARIDDDVAPDAEALAAREARRSAERAEFEFASGAERYERDDKS